MKKDQISVVVFKENKTPRTFLFPLHWIQSLGWTLAILTFVAIGSSAMAVKLYVKSLASDRTAPSDSEGVKTQSPEKTLGDPAEILTLKQQVLDLQTKLSAQATTKETQTSPLPVEIKAQILPQENSNASLFQSRFPTATTPKSELPIKLTKPKISLKNGQFRAQFFIQYIKSDGKNQTGKIVVLAKGGSMLLVYPEGVIQSAATLNQPQVPQSGLSKSFDISKGEYFSVSRIREVQAEIEGVNSQAGIEEVQIYIFDSQQNLILSELHTVSGPKISPAKPTPSESDSTDLEAQPNE